MADSDNPFTELPAPAVLWLDPGMVSGWARLAGGQFLSGQANFTLTGDIVSWHCDQDEDVSIGWERFDITPATWKMHGSNWALEVIGVTRWLTLQSGKRVLDPQSREARLMVQERLLKATGWHKPGLGHANDAARHLMAWLVREHRLPGSLRETVAQYVREREKA